MIHPTAVIHPQARIGSGCSIGPYAVIDGEVELGADCWVGPHVHLTGRTVIGVRNRFHTGCVVGDAPQDLKYAGAPTGLRIGDDNTFREQVTVHRSSRVDNDTEIGNGNFLMAGSHVGHDCRLGHGNIVANTALLSGHVEVADQAFISGSCLVHQFCRVGRLAMMQGGSGISKDLPPFCVSRGDNGLAGLNTVGLRRAGIGAEERLQLRAAYQVLFRSGTTLARALERARTEFADSPLVRELVEFVEAAQRGVCVDPGRRGA